MHLDLRLKKCYFAVVIKFQSFGVVWAFIFKLLNLYVNHGRNMMCATDKSICVCVFVCVCVCVCVVCVCVCCVCLVCVSLDVEVHCTLVMCMKVAKGQGHEGGTGSGRWHRVRVMKVA